MGKKNKAKNIYSSENDPEFVIAKLDYLTSSMLANIREVNVPKERNETLRTYLNICLSYALQADAVIRRYKEGEDGTNEPV